MRRPLEFALVARFGTACALATVGAALSAAPSAAASLVVQTEDGAVAGQCGARRGELSRHSLCGAPGRRIALEPAPASRALERCEAGEGIRQLLPAAQDARFRQYGGQRRLSGREHPAPDRNARGRQASGVRLYPRRRLCHRQRQQGRPGQDRSHEPGGRRHAQLPAGRAGLSRASVVDRRRRFRFRGPAGGARLDQAEHRRLRRRSKQYNDRRRVGGRLVGMRASCRAGLARPLQQGHHRERRLRQQACGASRGRGGRIRP